MSVTLPFCPSCGSDQSVKNGKIHNGKQNFRCQDCGRQFVEDPQNKIINQATQDLIDLPPAREAPLGWHCPSHWSLRTLATELCQRQIRSSAQAGNDTGKKKGRLTIQCDQMWSFVGNKGDKQWIWLALDISTREIVGVYVGARTREGARELWQSLPAVYRQCAVAYTDFWSAYEEIFPRKRHQAVGKESGKTSYIERFNCTLRQRVSRLVRKTLSFSKKLENHVGAVWLFAHHYNASLPI